MTHYILTETTLTKFDQRSIRIETYRNAANGLFRILTYELLKSDNAQGPHAHLRWESLSYNLQDTQDPVASAKEILEKITSGALPDHLQH